MSLHFRPLRGALQEGRGEAIGALVEMLLNVALHLAEGSRILDQALFPSGLTRVGIGGETVKVCVGEPTSGPFFCQRISMTVSFPVVPAKHNMVGDRLV